MPRFFALILIAGLMGCSAPGPSDPPGVTAALQTIYAAGVPHTDRQGRLMLAADPARSFFPIGIYHALEGEQSGHRYEIAMLAPAGFNTVHLWPGQDQASALAAARRAGLAAIVQHPSDAMVTGLRSEPALLAWMLVDEPTEFVSPEAMPAALAAFAARKAAVAALDPGRAVLVLDNAGIQPDQAARWRQWIVRGDVSAHFNYPFARQFAPVRDIERIARSVGRAVSLNGERKPVWFVAQAFAGTKGWTLPAAAELRAMVYAALVHGATGIIFFGLDSPVMREGSVAGVAPVVLPRYAVLPGSKAGEPPLELEDETASRHQALWRDVTDLNAELAALAPSLLEPTRPKGVQVEVSGRTRLANPVRVMLKPVPDGLLLLAVNLENTAVDARLRFDWRIAEASPLFSSKDPAPVLAGKELHVRFPAFGVGVYRLSLEEAVR